MTLQRVKEEFVVRLYYWARSQFEQEIHESFPTLRTFKCGQSWKIYRFMQTLEPSQQLAFAHSLLKRLHRDAVALLAERPSSEEEFLLAKFDVFWRIRDFYWYMHCFSDDNQVVDFCLHVPEASIVLGNDALNDRKALRSRLDTIYGPISPSFAEELEMRKVKGERVQFASRQKLQSVATRVFLDAFGDRCMNIQSNERMDRSSSIDIECSGWIISTDFWFGRANTLLRYTHAIVSPDSVARAESSFMPLAICLSFACWLGTVGQWDYVMPDEIESTCASAIKLCGHFFEVAPLLLKGLEYDVVRP